MSPKDLRPDVLAVRLRTMKELIADLDAAGEMSVARSGSSGT
ncbi:hypothetical protein [Georgenia subflava]|nr:hypothetical protein [Georgenia subflava]